MRRVARIHKRICFWCRDFFQGAFFLPTTTSPPFGHFEDLDNHRNPARCGWLTAPRAMFLCEPYLASLYSLRATFLFSYELRAIIAEFFLQTTILRMWPSTVPLMLFQPTRHVAPTAVLRLPLSFFLQLPVCKFSVTKGMTGLLGYLVLSFSSVPLSHQNSPSCSDEFDPLSLRMAATLVVFAPWISSSQAPRPPFRRISIFVCALWLHLAASSYGPETDRAPLSVRGRHC